MSDKDLEQTRQRRVDLITKLREQAEQDVSLLHRYNPFSLYKQIKAMDELSIANDITHENGNGGDFAMAYGNAKALLARSGVKFPKEPIQRTPEQLEQHTQSVEDLKEEVEQKFFAQKGLAGERSMLSKMNPAHALASERVFRGFDKLNEMLKASPENVSLIDAKFLLSQIEENIEKSGVDLERYNERAEQALYNKEENAALNVDEVVLQPDLEPVEELSPQEVYKKDLERQFDVIAKEEVKGVYRIKVRQAVAEQELVEAGALDMVEHPEVGLEDKVETLTHVAAARVGLEAPEKSEQENVLDRVREYSSAMEEQLSTIEPKDLSMEVEKERDGHSL